MLNIITGDAASQIRVRQVCGDKLTRSKKRRDSEILVLCLKATVNPSFNSVGMGNLMPWESLTDHNNSAVCRASVGTFCSSSLLPGQSQRPIWEPSPAAIQPFKQVLLVSLFQNPPRLPHTWYLTLKRDVRLWFAVKILHWHRWGLHFYGSFYNDPR